MTGRPKSDSIGTFRWKGIDGVVIPSAEEGYGVIFTADATRMIITVPPGVTAGVTNDMDNSEVMAVYQPMFDSIITMLDEMSDEISKGPE